MQHVNRAQPAMPVHLMKTFHVINPLESHWRVATCEEVDCGGWLNGWRTVIDETDPVGQLRAGYIRADASRKHVEGRDETGLTVFTFEAGQRCFKHEGHRTALDRDPLYVVRGGDWRGNPTGDRRVHTSSDFFIEDLGESLGNVLDGKSKG